jgi:hypothetical protein
MSENVLLKGKSVKPFQPAAQEQLFTYLMTTFRWVAGSCSITKNVTSAEFASPSVAVLPLN